jgi:hypothetical protein
VNPIEDDEDGCGMAAPADYVNDREQSMRRHPSSRASMPDGTGSGVEWLRPVVREARSGWSREEVTASDVLLLLTEEEGPATWLRALRDKVASVAAYADPGLLAMELDEVAAVATAWAAEVRRRAGA